MMDANLIPYAYLCNNCQMILVIPSFKDGRCPECGNSDKEILYMIEKKIVKDKYLREVLPLSA